MGFMQEVDGWLEKILVGLPKERLPEVKRLLKEKILESYRNGQGTPPKPAKEAPRRTRRHGR